VIFSPSRPTATNQLTPTAPLVVATTVAVLLVHVGALGLWQLKSSDQPLRKRPDLTIEFFTPAPSPLAAPVSAPPEPQAVSRPSTPPSQVTQTKPAQPEPVITTNSVATAPPATTDTATAAESTPVATPTVSETAPSTLPMANSEADYKAAYLNNPRPPYPLSASRQGAEGRVLLLAEVLPDGRAGRVSLEKSSGHALLDASAMNTVRSWRFTPARKDGVVTTQAVIIPIDFTLQNRR
jgi:periplasmic protein TonB